MADTDIKDFSITAADNSTVGGIAIADNSLTPGLIDNAFRAVLAVLAGSDFGTKTVKADTIAESTVDTGVTVDGLLIKDGGIAGAISLEGATLTGGLTMDGSAIDKALGAPVVSAATTDIWATDGNTAHVTGAAVITSLGTASQAGATRTVVFDGAATLTNGLNLILPGGADIVTAAGDSMTVLAETTAQARVMAYTKADGTAVVADVVPSAALVKFWVNFNGAGLIQDSYNVASVVKNSTGTYTITLITPFTTAGWCPAISWNSSGTPEATTMRVTSQTASTIVVLCETNSGADLDVDMGGVSGFGTQ